MAKVNAPLFSFNAAGQLAKALVYFCWKGIDCVRSYVIPSNPKTTKQTTQRGYMKAAVLAIHTAQALAADMFAEADAVAYALWGSCFATPRTWFNQAVKNQVDVAVAADTPALFYNGTLDNATTCQLDLDMDTDQATLAAATVFWGTSKTALINSMAGTVLAQEITASITGLTPGVKYFVQVRADAADPCEGAKSGIYTEYAT